MKTNNTPANVLNLLNAAEYVRNETIINGNQAAQLDAMTAEINNLTARRLECSGWYYIGTPTATGKTIYRRGNSELEIIIEEDSTATEFSELSHAARCLDIYLHNTREIYERYTVPAIERVTRALKAGEYVSDNAEQLAKDIQEIAPAISAAARLVRKYDHLTPTAQDIEQVTRNYAAYIVDCAKYEIENA